MTLVCAIWIVCYSGWTNKLHEGSLPCSQEPSTSPYAEPDQSSPYHPILSKIHFNITHLPTSWSSYSGLFPYGFPTNIPYAFLFSPFVLHAPPISSTLTLSFWLYLAKSISYDAPYYAVILMLFNDAVSTSRCMLVFFNLFHKIVQSYTVQYLTIREVMKYSNNCVRMWACALCV
jgi:hypothetical protein